MSSENTPPVDPHQPPPSGSSPQWQQPPAAYPAPGGAAPMTPADERTWATVAHVIPIAASILSAGFLGFVASLIVYLVYRDRGPFVRRFAANALNIQIMEFIAVVVSLPLMLVLVGFITLPLAIIVAAILHIIAAVRANQGEWYDPPMVPRFVK
ncbi:conserved hypothetical protein [Nostocoides japonicum T1-X7]|uniref:DUF4870 domain-containing protein n=1 Tax=Nostocoides japonicum T1-X7 TaxID=1194083 RepID=A0A077LWJ6_9MICO|nr:DUF4870 domain-containing protein [Tetrasphaera japonica]CCH78308.1 conserved hypothetical protein [Tetrasphaera japonica T1-X7]